MLDSIPDKVPKSITKKWIEVHDQSGDAENRHKSSKQIRFKTSMLQSDLCDNSDAYIFLSKELLLLKEQRIGISTVEKLFLVYQKLMEL